MARHKEFNRNEVLDKAMEVFWCKGYEATSVQELVECMGINRGSLYDTFGDKHSLFLEVIAHYDSKILCKLLTKLEQSDSAKQAIVSFIQELVERAIIDSQKRGCLLTNSMVELGPHDPEAAKKFVESVQKTEDAFYNALLKAQKKGEIEPDRDLKSLAHFLMCYLQGIKVLSRLNPDPSMLRDIAKEVITALG